MNHLTVKRTLLRAVALQTVVYAAIAFFGPCRPAPAGEGLAAEHRPILELLPSRRREAVECALAGWQTRRLPARNQTFGGDFTREHPDAYVIEYRQGDRAAIRILYSAANERIATRYSDR